MVSLRRDYLSQRGADAFDSDSDIDVVGGGDSGVETEGFGVGGSSSKDAYPPVTEAGVDLTGGAQGEKSRRPNPFSIESLLNT